MFTNIYTVALNGLDGFIVEVQTDLTNGMLAFDIIGLPDATVREARDRSKASIKNTGCEFPRKRITINLAPASQRKEGSGYDLAITMAILQASGQTNITDSEHTIFLGELALDGNLKPIPGVLPMVISALENGFKRCYVPAENAREASVVDGIDIYPVSSLSELLNHMDGMNPISPVKSSIDDFRTNSYISAIDMRDVKGQESAKRAIEIAASGAHNILMSGPAGTGKSMLAQRLSTILPDMTFNEILEVTKIHSIAGILPPEMPLITKRPFRSPHHTVSSAAMSGGGSIPHPGEVSLAHCGVLFLDELPEYKRDTLEVLRQPLEDGKISISRVNSTATYPCRVMLIAAMNPCPCGNYGNPKVPCTCTQNKVMRYRAKISGPLLDRIDLQIEIPAVSYNELSTLSTGDTSEQIRQRVNKARQIQIERYKDVGITSNSQLSAAMLDEYCALGDAENRMLKMAFDKFGLSARAHSKILKVSRTIADLDGSDDIKTLHIAEAIRYRNFDRR